MADSSPRQLPVLMHDRANFASIRLGHGLYVDKTQHFATLLASADTHSLKYTFLQNQYVFLARPRRFGKSLLVSTLEAWFQGMSLEQSSDLHKSDDLFAGTAGYETWKTLPIRPVIRLDMSKVQGSTPEQTAGKLTTHLWDLFGQWFRRGVEIQYDPKVIRPDASISPAEYLHHLIICLQRHYGLNPVVLVDEYDAPITHMIGHQTRETILESILEELHSFYGVLKSTGDYLHFVFLTGISRFGKINLFSALNNLQDISEDPRYATLCGFTEREVSQYLTAYLVQIADNIGWSLQDLWSYMQESYNGYQFSVSRTDVEQVYNPFTLLSSLNEWLRFDSDQAWREGQLTNHWANSGNPALLIRLIEMGRYCAPPEKPDLESLRRVSYDLEQLDYTALMWQTGYFTFRGGQDGEPLRLDYPNREVRDTYMLNLWEYLHGVGARWPERDKLYALYHALENQDYVAFCAGLLPLISGIPGEKLKEESDFHIIMDVLGYVMQLTRQSEGAVWGGRFDQAHEFENHVCVIELKYNRTAPEALAQIKTRRYIDKFRDRGVPIVGLGLNFVKDETAEAPRIEHKAQTLYDPAHPNRQTVPQGDT